MPFILVRGDITKVQVDAIVNAANSQLLEGGGVCGAIFQAAGSSQLEQSCALLAPVPTGDVAITPGFNLPSRYIIHAVGPIWQGGGDGEDFLLASCYTRSLYLAKEKGLSSIAFPLISAGIYGYPKDRAYHIAVSAILEFLEVHEMKVILVLFDDSFIVKAKADKELEAYIEQHQHSINEEITIHASMEPSTIYQSSLEQIDKKVLSVEESFSSKLFRFIEEKKLDEVKVYKRANIDRKHFSKIRSNDSYQPSKMRVFAFAISLCLCVEETKELLMSAGYSLSQSYLFDIIIEYFLQKELYDIHAINEFLFSYNQPLIGG